MTATGGVDTTAEFISVDGIVATGVYGVAVPPTNSSTALDATWTDLGLTTDAGVTRSAPATRTKRYAWQNRVKLRTITTDAAVRFVFTLVQTSKDSIAVFHGVALSAGSIVTNPAREWPIIAFDLDTIDGVNRIREYAPRAQVVEVGDQVAITSDTWGWPITVEAQYDSGIAGYTKQFYSEFEVVPTISAATPSAVAVGGYVKITGTGFLNVTGAAGVKFGGTNATSYDINDDTEIYAIMPAGSAGSAPITVTNPNGTSSALSYTRGA